MKSSGKNNIKPIEELKTKLKKSGIRSDKLTEIGGHIKSENGQFAVEKDISGFKLIIGEEEISLGDYNLEPFLKREGRYETGSLIIITAR